MIIAVIAAAGEGLRFGGPENKLYLDLLGKPLIAYSLAAMEAAKCVDGVILVTAADKVDYCQKEVVDRLGYNKVIKVIGGGGYRQESVYFGVLSLPTGTDKVIVHDGARPLVKPDKIEEVARACSRGAGAISAVPVTDTIKRADKNSLIKETIERRSLWRAQTPQVFKRNNLLAAHEWARENRFIGTDEAAIYEATRRPVKIVAGDYDNIKVTTYNDFVVAKALLLERTSSK